MDNSERSLLASTVFAVLEPLIELLLEYGVTSPEAESLLRSIYVHKAQAILAKRNGDVPSDSRVALATGIHRNFVREILKSPPQIAPSRRARGMRVDRLLEGWRSDPDYLAASGKPLPLWRLRPEPSIKSLIKKYLPGAPIESTLEQAIRSGQISVQPDGRLRPHFVSSNSRGRYLGRVSKVGETGSVVLQALCDYLLRDTGFILSKDIQFDLADPAKLQAVGLRLERHAVAFLTGLAKEISDPKEKTTARSAASGNSQYRLVLYLALTDPPPPAPL